MTSYHLIARGYPTDARTSAQRVEAIGETLRDVGLQVAAQYYRLHIDYQSGDYRGAEDTSRKLMQFLQGL